MRLCGYDFPGLPLRSQPRAIEFLTSQVDLTNPAAVGNILQRIRVEDGEIRIQLLGIGQRHVVNRDGHAVLMSFLDNGEIQRRREFLATPSAVIDPDLDEFGVDADIGLAPFRALLR